MNVHIQFWSPFWSFTPTSNPSKGTRGGPLLCPTASPLRVFCLEPSDSVVLPLSHPGGCTLNPAPPPAPSNVTRYGAFRPMLSSAGPQATCGWICSANLNLNFKKLSLIFKIIFYLFVYPAVLGLHCCGFSGCGKRGLFSVAVPRLLIAIASPIAQHGL